MELTHSPPSTRADKVGPYTLLPALKVCLDAAKGMVYLHSADLIHRDLKSMNIMISDGMQGKIADYGESREEITDMTMTSTGTPLWMAPEVSKAGRYDSQADVYSFGIILFEVLKRDLPYSERTDLNAIGLAVKVALDGLRPTIEEDWHPGLKSLLKDCYETIPSDRPTFSQIEPRLRKVIENIGAREGKPALALDISSNLRGLDLWRTIQLNWRELSKGDKIGGVGLPLFLLLALLPALSPFSSSCTRAHHGTPHPTM